MDETHHIWRAADGADAVGRDTFSKLLSECNNILLGLCRHATVDTKSVQHMFMGRLKNREKKTQLNLYMGETLDLIARKKCEVHRDVFLLSTLS
jgi:hypothetical protein